MPTWLRHTTFQFIQDFYDKEKEEMEKARGGQQWTSSKPSPPPAVQQALKENKVYKTTTSKPG